MTALFEVEWWARIQKDLKKMAYGLGSQDARQGRVFRHSAEPGHWVNHYLKDYDRGWAEGRQDESIR